MAKTQLLARQRFDYEVSMDEGQNVNYAMMGLLPI
jgi:hypothetical protein